MKWNRVVSALFTLGLVVACGPSNAPQGANPRKTDDSPTPKPPDTRTTEVCYMGNGKKECFSTLAIAALPEQQSLYKYLDPKSTSGFPGSANQYAPPDHILNLRNLPANLKLSPHFQVSEFMRPGSDRGFYGLFSPAVILNLEKMRTQANRSINLTSGYRSPGYNDTLPGAAKWSRHMYGDAIDFYVSGLSQEAMVNLCMANGAYYPQKYTDGHVHCDWRSTTLEDAFYPLPERSAQLSPQLAIRRTEGTFLINASQRITTDVPQEDEGTLTHEWTVRGANGFYLESTATELELPAAPGEYEITVIVGGSTVLQKRFTRP